MHSSKGLEREELKNQIIERLRYINYYRLSSYWALAFTGNSPKRFHPGTYWEDVMERYMFDRKLRQIIFDAISRIEIALRTQIAYNWVKETQEDAPQRRSNNYTASFRYKDFLSKVNAYYIDNQSEEATFYRKQYSDATLLPAWVFVEFTTFGNLQKLMDRGFKSSSSVVNIVSSDLGYPEDTEFFLSGIALLKDIRNACAHQSRVWDRRWLSRKGTSILKNSKNPLWRLKWNDYTHSWSNITDGDFLISKKDSTATALTFCYQIIKNIAPHSQWKSRLITLMSSPNSPTKNVYKILGFSNEHWMNHPLWQ